MISAFIKGRQGGEMKVRRRFAWALAAGAALTIAVAGVLGGAASSAQAVPPDPADAVLDWNQYAAEALINA
ncbi:MAG TPA: hypothetical protein VIV37_07715, partial [Gaiellaceae bacterium]